MRDQVISSLPFLCFAFSLSLFFFCGDSLYMAENVTYEKIKKQVVKESVLACCHRRENGEGRHRLQYVNPKTSQVEPLRMAHGIMDFMAVEILALSTHNLKIGGDVTSIEGSLQEPYLYMPWGQPRLNKMVVKNGESPNRPGYIYVTAIFYQKDVPPFKLVVSQYNKNPGDSSRPLAPVNIPVPGELKPEVIGEAVEYRQRNESGSAFCDRALRTLWQKIRAKRTKRTMDYYLTK